MADEAVLPATGAQLRAEFRFYVTTYPPTTAMPEQVAIGINGFGRIGRLVCRAAIENPKTKVVAINEVEELQQKQLLERKRRDAERRLMATKRRKHESFMASQSMMMMSQMQSQSQSQSQQLARPPPAPVVETAVQTELKLSEEAGKDGGNKLKEENSRLMSYLLTGTSRDLLTLLNGTVPVSVDEDAKPHREEDRTQPPQGCHSATPSQYFQGSSGNSFSDSMQQSPGAVPFSQSVFSQVAGRASAQAHASLVSFAMETKAAQTTLATDRARELYDVMGKMLAGDVSAVVLAPVFVKYLTAPTDLEVPVICSVLRVMYSVIHHSTHFQHFLLVASSPSDESSSTSGGPQRGANSMEHSRISLPGLRFTSLDDYVSARTDYDSVVSNDLAAEAASEQRQLRSKLLTGLCRVIKNNLKEPAVVKDGLSVLCLWVDLGLTHRPALTPDFKPLLASNVIPAILLAPKGLPIVKAHAVGLLSRLLRVPEIFAEIETESKKSLVFNRCAKMLASEENLSLDEVKNMRTLQHQIVKLLLSIITSFPSVGIRFVLESTRGFPSDSDGYRSVIYYLAQLLHQETFALRTAHSGGDNCVARQWQNDPFRLDLIHDAFALIGLLSRYVDLPSELSGDDQVQTFLAVLCFLSNLTQDDSGGVRNDSIVATARFLLAMMNLPRSGEPSRGVRDRRVLIKHYGIVLSYFEEWNSKLIADLSTTYSDLCHFPSSEAAVVRLVAIRKFETQPESVRASFSTVRFAGRNQPRSRMGHLAAFQTLLLLLVGLGVGVVLASEKSCFELPIVIVSPTKVKLPTETCNQPRLPAPDCMRDSVEANIEVIDNQGALNCLSGNRTGVYPASVHYRGQSSLHFTKHQMSVDLDEDAELLGFPADRTYVLNGPTVDASLMRNHLAHWMYRGTERYSPRTRHVVVFVRDELDANDWSPRYRGIYLALEKIAYTPNRVGLSALDNSCQSKEELSGGWAWQNNPLGYGDYSPNIVLNEATGLFGAGARPILTFPEPKMLTQSMRDYFISPETGPLPRLYQYLYDNMTHPDGLEEHIDIGSFVDYFLHSELSMNSDAYRRSTYFFKDRNQPINAGPVWDFNLAYGLGSAQTGWMYTIHTFWKRLGCNYKYASLVQQRWVKLRSTTWNDESIRSFIQTSAEPIQRQLKNCVEWKSDNLQCANVEAKTKGSFEDEVNALLKAVLARALWMDANVAGFYKTLDHNLCVAAGELPAYNCAANGNDKGCLVNPATYSNAVEFPEPRKPLAAKLCTASNISGTVENPSIDPCWLSAGVYMLDGSITPFCSGYGFCPEGPGAKCACNSGHPTPTCARDDDAIVPRGGIIEALEALSSYGRYLRYPLFFLCAISAMALGVAFAIRQRRRQRYVRLRHPAVRSATNSYSQDGRELRYGTL
ncbi:hypothetical protein ON010_g11862 [Phytophthora cinnamomi]|nr:hypothetical protein ON010_g11862 [Phytophthora cinnamomi]